MTDGKISVASIVTAFGPGIFTDRQLAQLQDGTGDPAEILRSGARQLKTEERSKIWRGVLGKWVLFPHPCGAKVWLRLGDAMAMGILRSQRDDPATRYVLSRLTKGGTFFDIGANHGWFALRAAQTYRKLGSGKVVAFEPQPDMYDHLCQSIRENDFSDIVEVLQLALGDQNRQVAMSASELNSGGSQVILDRTGELTNISMRRFDDVAADVECVDCVKIDIEGAEPLFFSGAKSFIERRRPVIYSEVNGRKLRKLCGVVGTQYIQDVESIGYRTLLISRSGDTVPFDGRSSNAAEVFNVVFEPVSRE